MYAFETEEDLEALVSRCLKIDPNEALSLHL